MVQRVRMGSNRRKSARIQAILAGLSGSLGAYDDQERENNRYDERQKQMAADAARRDKALEIGQQNANTAEKRAANAAGPELSPLFQLVEQYNETPGAKKLSGLDPMMDQSPEGLRAQYEDRKTKLAEMEASLVDTPPPDQNAPLTPAGQKTEAERRRIRSEIKSGQRLQKFFEGSGMMGPETLPGGKTWTGSELKDWPPGLQGGMSSKKPPMQGSQGMSYTPEQEMGGQLPMPQGPGDPAAMGQMGMEQPGQQAQQAAFQGMAMPQGANAQPADQQMAGQMSHWAMMALDPQAPPELQAQAWVRLHDMMGIPIPMMMQAMLGGGGPPQDTMMGGAAGASMGGMEDMGERNPAENPPG